MRTVLLPDGTPVPAIGQGTYRLGEHAGVAKSEIAILKGMTYGMVLIDTAADYALGGVESIVGEAIKLRHNGAFVVTKVVPQKAGRKELPLACDESLARLKINVIDLYLIHWWWNSVPNLDMSQKLPLEEIIEGFEALKTAGKIKRWGVSNFRLQDMQALLAAGGTACQTNQVLYNLAKRDIEADLPWYQTAKIPIMAYSPMGISWGVINHPVLAQIADRHDATPAQIALSWVLRHDNVIAIPKADRPSHTRYNALSAELQLEQEDYAALEVAFPR